MFFFLIQNSFQVTFCYKVSDEIQDKCPNNSVNVTLDDYYKLTFSEFDTLYVISDKEHPAVFDSSEIPPSYISMQGIKSQTYIEITSVGDLTDIQSFSLKDIIIKVDEFSPNPIPAVFYQCQFEFTLSDPQNDFFSLEIDGYSISSLPHARVQTTCVLDITGDSPPSCFNISSQSINVKGFPDDVSTPIIFVSPDSMLFVLDDKLNFTILDVFVFYLSTANTLINFTISGEFNQMIRGFQLHFDDQALCNIQADFPEHIYPVIEATKQIYLNVSTLSNFKPIITTSNKMIIESPEIMYLGKVDISNTGILQLSDVSHVYCLDQVLLSGHASIISGFDSSGDEGIPSTITFKMELVLNNVNDENFLSTFGTVEFDMIKSLQVIDSRISFKSNVSFLQSKFLIDLSFDFIYDSSNNIRSSSQINFLNYTNFESCDNFSVDWIFKETKLPPDENIPDPSKRITFISFTQSAPSSKLFITPDSNNVDGLSPQNLIGQFLIKENEISFFFTDMPSHVHIIVCLYRNEPDKCNGYDHSHPYLDMPNWAQDATIHTTDFQVLFADSFENEIFNSSLVQFITHLHIAALKSDPGYPNIRIGFNENEMNEGISTLFIESPMKIDFLNLSGNIQSPFRLIVFESDNITFADGVEHRIDFTDCLLASTASNYYYSQFLPPKCSNGILSIFIDELSTNSIEITENGYNIVNYGGNNLYNFNINEKVFGFAFGYNKNTPIKIQSKVQKNIEGFRLYLSEVSNHLLTKDIFIDLQNNFPQYPFIDIISPYTGLSQDGHHIMDYRLSLKKFNTTEFPIIFRKNVISQIIFPEYNWPQKRKEVTISQTFQAPKLSIQTLNDNLHFSFSKIIINNETDTITISSNNNPMQFNVDSFENQERSNPSLVNLNGVVLSPSTRFEITSPIDFGDVSDLNQAIITANYKYEGIQPYIRYNPTNLKSFEIDAKIDPQANENKYMPTQFFIFKGKPSDEINVKLLNETDKYIDNEHNSFKYIIKKSNDGIYINLQYITKKHNDKSTVTIVVLTIGGVIIIGCAIWAVFYLHKKRQTNDLSYSENEDPLIFNQGDEGYTA